MQKTISIIIPAYNASKFITETIDSVMNQSFINWELLIIDDGSKDNTAEIAQKYAERDNRINVFKQVNSGVSVARNKGLENSTGNYICFLDADDVLNPDNLEIKLNSLVQNNWDTVYSACELIDQESRSLNKTITGYSAPSIKDILELKGNYITAPSGFLYKKTIFETTGGFEPKLSNNADQELFVRILHNNFKIGYIPQPLWKYRIHNSNMSGNIKLLETDSIYMFDKFNQLNIFQTKRYAKKCYAKLYYMLGGSWWKNGNNKVRGSYFFILSILSNPFVVLNKIFNK